MRTSGISLTIATAAFLAAGPVLADQGAQSRVDVNPEPDRAEQLQAEAEALYGEPTQWKKAVRLLEESAELRDADDPEAYQCLIYAGRIQAAIDAGKLDGSAPVTAEVLVAAGVLRRKRDGVRLLADGEIGAAILDELPRPRNENVRTSAEFGSLYRRISAALRGSEP